ncbi:MAG: asparagine synthase (glutamine-hydrolyzing) [Deltaproteobacteria bacterium]|nr:asparagine synthase (glutamine-hydrolyzing) [Deltaproteobacteria bacterium]
MCGIFAALRSDGGVVPELLDRGISAIGHRGPDGRGRWIASDGTAGLAHTRLSVIDLETGSQPLSNETGALQLIVNGELYGYREQRKALESRGHAFRTTSDSEVILHLYEELGVHCLRELRGEFAFALWDERRKLLFAARDRFGIKPIHYTTSTDGFLLASEIKALFAAGASARWDRTGFAEVMCGLLPLGSSHTLFEGVRQIPPGHFLLVAPGGSPRLVRYWDLDFPKTSPTDTPTEVTEEQVDTLRDRLVESVRLRLIADVPVGVYLSGGIDSSAILGIAAQHAERRLDAFTIGFDAEALDERGPAARTAEHVGARFVPFETSLDLLADHFADAVVHSEYPHDNPHGTAKLLLSRLAREHGIKVVLAGEGADEIFLGYPWLVLDSLKSTPGFEKPSALTSALGPQAARVVLGVQATSLAGGRHPSMIRIKRVLGTVPSLLWLASATFMNPEVRSFLRPETRESLTHLDFIERLLEELDVQGQLEGRHPARRSAYLQLKSTFVSYNLNVLGDRMEMANAVEARLPYLDHPFVEAVKDAPVRSLFQPGLDKLLLRRIARPFVTDEIYHRPKLAFMAPDVEGKGRFGELIRDTLYSRLLDDHPLYDPLAIRKAVESKASVPFARSKMILTFLSGCLLQSQFRPS